MSNGIHPHVVGFLRWRPDLLYAKEIPTDGAFASPRAYESVSHIMHLTVSADVEREMIAGTIGDGAATEFCAYLRTARELPSIDAILAAPEKAAVPTSPSVLYALTTCLSQYTRQIKKPAMAYIQRLPAEFALLYIMDIRDHFDIRSDAAIYAWIGNHKQLFARG
jgi:hypothetical protein